jgi:hypothetical protein
VVGLGAKKMRRTTRGVSHRRASGKTVESGTQSRGSDVCGSKGKKGKCRKGKESEVACSGRSLALMHRCTRGREQRRGAARRAARHLARRLTRRECGALMVREWERG